MTDDEFRAIVAALDKLSAELEQRAPSKWKQSGREYAESSGTFPSGTFASPVMGSASLASLLLSPSMAPQQIHTPLHKRAARPGVRSGWKNS